MFAYLGWMAVPLILLTALGVAGYLVVVLRCTEEEFRKEAAQTAADAHRAADSRAVESYRRFAGRAA